MAVSPLVDDDFLAAIDEIRGIPDEAIGVRPISVTVRVVQWDGGRVGLGNPTVTDSPLLVGNGQWDPHVTQISARDALASGGKYTNQDVRVGPMTPAYAATLGVSSGGVASSTIDPPVQSASAEVYFKLAGDGYQGAQWFTRIGDELVSSTKYFLILRKAGVSNPGNVP